MNDDSEWKSDVANDSFGMSVSDLTERECSDQIDSLTGKQRALGLSPDMAKRLTKLKAQHGKMVRKRLR